MDGFKRSRFPAFGNWEYSDGVPTTTDYFDYAAATEQARQAAGYIPFTFGYEDLYATVSADFVTDDNIVSRKAAKPTKTKGSERKKHCRHGYIKEPKKQGRVCDVPQQLHEQHGVHLHAAPKPKPKPVDEDLYKIPPELLHTQSKRKKMLGFFSRCLVPTCAL